MSSKCGFVAFQNLESKLASCRDYINEQAANRRSRGGGQGTPSGCGDSSESHPTNGLYNKGWAAVQCSRVTRGCRGGGVDVWVCWLVVLHRLMKRLDFGAGPKLLLWYWKPSTAIWPSFQSGPVRHDGTVWWARGLFPWILEFVWERLQLE